MITIESIELPLKVIWKLSRNSTLVKTNFIISLDEVYKAEVAPNIRYGETAEIILEQFKMFQEQKIATLDEVRAFLKESSFCHSLMFALEAVFVHKEASLNHQSVCEFLNLKQIKSVETSFSVPIMELEGIESYVKNVSHYPYLKIKVNKEMAKELVNEVSKFYQGPLRVDGNEAWDNLEDYLDFENSLLDKNIEFIEQPFKAQDKDLYKKLFQVSKYPLIADESVEDQADFNELSSMFHGINVKLMKAGGYFKAIELLENAKKSGLKTMIGCMVETTLGIQSGLYLASLADYIDLDGFLLLKDEPFNLVSDNNGILSLTNN